MRVAFALALAAVVVCGAVLTQRSSSWDDPEHRNKEGWRVCQGWLDATPEERKQMPDWCEDWATGDE